MVPYQGLNSLFGTPLATLRLDIRITENFPTGQPLGAQQGNRVLEPSRRIPPRLFIMCSFH